MICTPKVRHIWRCIFYMAKKGQVFKKYSAEFKIMVIMDMRENRLGYRETARKYDLVKQSELRQRYPLKDLCYAIQCLQ